MGDGGVSAAQRNARAPLLERDREVAALDELISAATGGEGWFALLEAVAGMGKTRLVTETRRRAEEAGLRVLPARGGELEREFAFGVVRQLFEPALGRRETSSPAPRPGARAVFDADAAGGADAASFAALHGLYWLVAQPERGAAARCSRSTTCTGATARRCGSSPTWRGGWRAAGARRRRAAPGRAGRRRGAARARSSAIRGASYCVPARSAPQAVERARAGAARRKRRLRRSQRRATTPRAATRCSSTSS